MNVYVILAERFADLYEPAPGQSEHGAVHRAKGIVSALPFPAASTSPRPGASGKLRLRATSCAMAKRSTAATRRRSKRRTRW